MVRLRVGSLGGALGRRLAAEQGGEQTAGLVLGRPNDDAAGPYWVGNGTTQEPQEGSVLSKLHGFLFCAVWD